MLNALADEAVTISEKPGDKFCVVARRDTWSRSARRRTRGLDSSYPATGEVLLVAHVCMDGEVELVVEWKRGQDVQAFDKLACHIGRKIVVG